MTLQSVMCLCMWRHLMEGALGTRVKAVAARRAVHVRVVCLVEPCLLRWREVEGLLLAWCWCPCRGTFNREPFGWH